MVAMLHHSILFFKALACVTKRVKLICRFITNRCYGTKNLFVDFSTDEVLLWSTQHSSLRDVLWVGKY